MTTYRDEKHAAVRAIAGDGRSLCSRASWQGQYRSGAVDALLAPTDTGEALDFADRLLQDAMTRQLIHRALTETQWLTLLALYAPGDAERGDALRRLADGMTSPAGTRFRRWCVACWALPRLRPELRQLRDWDGQGVSDRTLRHWRQSIHRQLDAARREAFAHLERVLADAGLVPAMQRAA